MLVIYPPRDHLVIILCTSLLRLLPVAGERSASGMRKMKRPVFWNNPAMEDIGVVLFINHEARTEEIIKWTDRAMYQAKEAGGNLIRFYEAAGA